MTGFKLTAPPADRRPVITFVVSIVAALLGAVILANFVDALYVSIARGEAMRTAHRMEAPTNFQTDKQAVIAQASQRSVTR